MEYLIPIARGIKPGDKYSFPKIGGLAKYLCAISDGILARNFYSQTMLHAVNNASGCCTQKFNERYLCMSCDCCANRLYFAHLCHIGKVGGQ